MKKTFLITVLLCALTLFAQENKEITLQKDEFLSNLSKLSPQELIDKALYHYNKSSFDTMLIYCNLIINTTPKNADIERQTILLQAYNRTAIVYAIMADYRLAYDYFIKALNIGEKYDLSDYLPNIYNNIGAIYMALKNFELAKQYYLKAIEISPNNASMTNAFNNLSATHIQTGDTDSAYYCLNKAIGFSKKNKDKGMQNLLNNLASYYQKEKQYDSAFYYYRLSIEYSKKNNDIRLESINLSELGKLFFEINKIDSALYYIDLSNKIASENKFLKIITDNYLTLSEIEKSKGRYKNALELYETYIDLKDSIFNSNVYGSVNLLQRQYEVSKTNQQIEELIIDRQIKENTIHYQKIILYIIIAFSSLMVIVLLITIKQNKKLKKAYNVLIDKNLEIIELTKTPPSTPPQEENNEEESGDLVQSSELKVQNSKFKVQSLQPETLNPKPETLNFEPETLNLIPESINSQLSTADSHSSAITSEDEKFKKFVLSKKAQNELLNKILTFMESNSEIYNPEFTMEKLSDLIFSNKSYISFVINNILKKNFRLFLNGYRVREAQKLFSEKNNFKYSVEFVANAVGFKSRNSFYEAFKEVAGVTPAFFVKSLAYRTEMKTVKKK